MKHFNASAHEPPQITLDTLSHFQGTLVTCPGHYEHQPGEMTMCGLYQGQEHKIE